MHRHLNFTFAALLALIAGGAATGTNPDPADKAAPQKDRMKRQRAAYSEQSRRHPRRSGEVPALFRDLCPYRAARLEKIRENNPERFREFTRQLGRKMHEMERMRRENAEEFNRHTGIMRLEDKAAQTADKLRASRDPAAASALKRELAADLEELFDRKEQAQRARLKRMEHDLQKLKERLDDRRRKRKELIEKRLEELTGAEPSEF